MKRPVERRLEERFLGSFTKEFEFVKINRNSHWLILLLISIQFDQAASLSFIPVFSPLR